MDQSANDKFSFYLGILAVVSAAVSSVLFLKTYLPGAQLKLLNEVLTETHEIFEKALADDLLPSEAYKSKAEESLKRSALSPRFAVWCFLDPATCYSLDNLTTVLRERVYRLNGILDEYCGLIQGLSRTIQKPLQKAIELRSELVVSGS